MVQAGLTPSLCSTPMTPVPSSPPTPQASQVPPTSEAVKITGEQITDIALKYVGYGYTWGGSSPGVGFDCSGFIGYVYKEAGLPVPDHDLSGQLSAGPRVDLDRLQPGDLVFFQNTYRAGLSHGGIYIGGGRFIHAVEEGVGVQVNNMDDSFWSGRFLGASRPWATDGR